MVKLETYESSSIKNKIKDKDIPLSKVIGTLFLILLLGMIVFSSFYTVNAGERAVLLTWGNPSTTAVTEGLHFKFPIAQKAVIMDIKTQKYQAELTAASKDLQDVNTVIAVNYHLIGESVPRIYQEIGLDYSDRVINPLEQETNKAITSQFTAEELITKRNEVRQKMKDLLYEKLLPRGIVVEEVSIIDFQFSESFSQAIENKVTAEQNALTAKNKLEQVKFEAAQQVAQAEGARDAQIAKAQGEQESIRLIQQELTHSPQYIEWLKASKWDGQLPKVTGGATPLIDVSSISK